MGWRSKEKLDIESDRNNKIDFVRKITNLKLDFLENWWGRINASSVPWSFSSCDLGLVDHTEKGKIGKERNFNSENLWG